ncbi:hypothetical protein IMW75_22825 [Pseudomonas gregormendelii]|uniref:Uncharacterized protein n=1 Tax=Pseudomonas gregormendelii TaxID=1628277 RepID=A0ABS3AMB2_9PSED|nr:hypothetical protein [Pseudomonas gregormendelii]
MPILHQSGRAAGKKSTEASTLAAMRSGGQLSGIDPHEHRVAHRCQHAIGIHLADHPGLAANVTAKPIRIS